MTFTITDLKAYASKLPSVSEAVNAVDRSLSTGFKHTAEFLDTHPGIAMLLSPGTVTRRVAQKHVDNIINYK